MFCPNCGKELPDDSAFCPDCGTKLIEEQQIIEKKHSNGTKSEFNSVAKPTPQSGKNDRKKIIIPIAICIAGIILFGIGTSIGKKGNDKQEENVSEGNYKMQIPDDSVKNTEISEENSTGKTGDVQSKVEEKAPNGIENPIMTENQAADDNLSLETDEESINDAKDSAIHKYEVIVADVTWTEAYKACTDRSGYLVNINSQEEYDYLVNILREGYAGTNIIWIGSTLDSVTGNEYHWIDQKGNSGQEVLNTDPKYADFWLDGEPSFVGDDGKGNTFQEQYLDMIYIRSKDQYLWNDAPNDLLKIVPDYSGKIGYICEYE